MDPALPLTQAPDLSFLQGLDPGVAYAALAVIALGMLLFYLGPGLRARFTRTAPPPTETTPAIPAVPASPQQALDRSDQRTDQFIDHLLRIDAARARDNEALESELRDSRDEIERLRTQLWRRGDL